MLLDNTLKVYLPDGNWVFRDYNSMIRFPDKIDSFKNADPYQGDKVDPEEAEFRKLRYPKAYFFDTPYSIIAAKYIISVKLQ